MAIWIGPEIGLDIQQHSLDKTRMKYWADGFKEYEGISYNPSFGIRFVRNMLIMLFGRPMFMHLA